MADTRDPATEVDEEAFSRLYGRWEPLSPEAVAALFEPMGISWWIVGGHAIEAFTGVGRHHSDIDVSIFRRDLPALRASLGGRFHLWSVGSAMFRPLNAEFPEPHAESDQVWVREHALAPWVMDVQLNPDVDGQWQSRRERDFVAPLADVTWLKDGIRYLDPAIALSFKAKGQRPKDDADFEAALPLLSRNQRTFLAGFLERNLPEHPWRTRLSD